MQEAAATGVDGTEADGGGDAGRALEERAKVQTLLQAAQDGDLDALKVCAVSAQMPKVSPFNCATPLSDLL